MLLPSDTTLQQATWLKKTSKKEIKEIRYNMLHLPVYHIILHREGGEGGIAMLSSNISKVSQATGGLDCIAEYINEKKVLILKIQMKTEGL